MNLVLNLPVPCSSSLGSIFCDALEGKLQAVIRGIEGTSSANGHMKKLMSRQGATVTNGHMKKLMSRQGAPTVLFLDPSHLS
ncbi:hypothetical protein NC651_030547 [Populus alba x Populus x berolinensis]|nr:hypothetical protein NC651_030547 [Populus alba x Populus x berolinensis]